MSFWTDKEKDALSRVELRSVFAGQERLIASPGVATLTTPDGRPLEWQVQQGIGLSGARAFFRGTGLAEFVITLRLWTPDHRRAYQGWYDFVKAPRPGEAARIYKISHPVLALLGIDQCFFKNDPGVTPDGLTDSITLQYKCSEYRKPQPTLSSPTTPGGADQKGNADSRFRDQVRAEVEANSREIEALGRQLAQ